VNGTVKVKQLAQEEIHYNYAYPNALIYQISLVTELYRPHQNSEQCHKYHSSDYPEIQNKINVGVMCCRARNKLRVKTAAKKQRKRITCEIIKIVNPNIRASRGKLRRVVRRRKARHNYIQKLYLSGKYAQYKHDYSNK
jgi:hypothetical protein